MRIMRRGEREIAEIDHEKRLRGDPAALLCYDVILWIGYIGLGVGFYGDFYRNDIKKKLFVLMGI